MNVIAGAMELLLATSVASMLGSLHCVAMCGPFAILASNSATNPNERIISNRLIAYHAGRLITYVLMGLIAGTFSSLLLASGVLKSVGLVVGGLLIAMALARFWVLLFPDSVELFRSNGETPWHSGWVMKWSKGLARVRRWIPKDPVWLGPLGWGLTTTLLPCGWLYLFVLTAAAAPNLGMAVATMVAFWLGTLPLLSLSTLGWARMGKRWQTLSGPVAACCILGMGLYLIVARSPVDVSRLQSTSESMPLVQVANHESKNPVEAKLDPTHTAKKRWGADYAGETGRQRLERMRKMLNAGLPCCELFVEETQHDE
jgi:uncharacterized protein